MRAAVCACVARAADAWWLRRMHMRGVRGEQSNWHQGIKAMKLASQSFYMCQLRRNQMHHPYAILASQRLKHHYLRGGGGDFILDRHDQGG